MITDNIILKYLLPFAFILVNIFIRSWGRKRDNNLDKKEIQITIIIGVIIYTLYAIFVI